ncbi:MAG: CcmD family protein [Acidobacteriota bacterium]|nr:CcmD family protein [Acidobacteriota bacterium]
MKNYEFLFWAYAVIWAGLAAFIGFAIYRLEKVGRRVERLERAVRDRR